MNEIKEMVQKLALQMTSLSSRQDRQVQRLSSQLREIKDSWETKRNLDDHTYLVMAEVKKREIEQRNCPLIDERPEAINIVLNNNASNHIIHVPAVVATAVVAEKNHHVMQDPITTWKKYMSEENLTSEVELKGIDKKIDKLVKEVEFADASPVRDRSQLLEHVFADPRSCRIGPDPRHKVMTGVLANEENEGFALLKTATDKSGYTEEVIIGMNVAASGVYGKDKICDLNFKRKVAELWSKSLMVDCNLKAPLPLSLSSSLDQIFATTIMNEKNVAELILSQSQVLILLER
nr:PREDICTED: uncharacterized protein LOC107796735 [Nicotiana tabacum]